jgi:hypothetical protein
VFGLRVNDLFLINVSAPFLNAPNLGMPHMRPTAIDLRGGTIAGVVEDGTKIVHRPINWLGSVADGCALHQCILNNAGSTVLSRDQGRLYPNIVDVERGESALYYEMPSSAGWLGSDEQLPIAALNSIWWEDLVRTWQAGVLSFQAETTRELLNSPSLVGKATDLMLEGLQEAEDLTHSVQNWRR